MNEKTFNELYEAYAKACTLNNYKEVTDLFDSLGIIYKFTHNYDNPDPLFTSVTKVTLCKDDTELSLNSSDDVFHEHPWR